MSKPQHPAPWKWYRDESDNDNLPGLEDGEGNWILHFGSERQYYPTEGTPPDDPQTCEIIRAAPEMLAMLRKHEWSASDDDRGEMYCPECGGLRPGGSSLTSEEEGHEADCALAAILARIDGTGT